MLKKIFFIIIAVAIFIPYITHAQVDQRCWTEPKCVSYVSETFGVPEADAKKNNFYSATDHDDAKAACKGTTDSTTNEPLGFCLPAGKSVTGISFGGSRTFDNIGTFIQYIYRYGFIIGSIVAVLMIMLAGVMWIFSGGSQEVIGTAHKRIGNAVIGLVLLALSYTILNLVNPYLVNFRLPDIWLINKSGLATQYCNDMAENTKIFKVGNTGTKIPDTAIKSAQAQKFTMKAKEAQCGEDYIFQNGGSQTCGGNLCDPGKEGVRACLPFDIPGTGSKSTTKTENDIIKHPHCWHGDMTLHFKVDSYIDGLINTITKNLLGVLEESDDDVWLNDLNMYSGTQNNISSVVFCENKEPETVEFSPIATRIEKMNKYDEFIFQFKYMNKKIESICSGNTPKGIVFKFSLNENNTSDDKPFWVFLSEKDGNITTIDNLSAMEPKIIPAELYFPYKKDTAKYYTVEITKNMMSNVLGSN